MRFLLALAVIVNHTTPIFGLDLVGGQLAVKAFYIISGFYMTLILNEKYIDQNNSYNLFITNRLLRLYPIYWAILLLCVVYGVGSIFITGHFASTVNNFVQYHKVMKADSLIFLIFTNIFLFLQDAVMFLGLDSTTGHLFFTANFRNTTPMLWTFLVVPQAWTIGLEIAFYLIAPFIVRKKISLIMFLIAASLALRIVMNYSGLNDDPWSYRFFPTELVFFLLGTLAYHIQKHLSKINIPPVYYKIILSLTLAFTLFYSLLPISAVIKPWLYILFVFGSLPFVFISTKTQKFDRYIGELSYPMYLSHTFLLACVMSLKIKPIGSLGITVTILTVLLSIALNELIAKRIEKLRQRRVAAIA